MIVWIILMESFSWRNVIVGMILGVLISYCSSTLLPNSKGHSKKIEHLKFHKLITYPLWLIVKVYKDGFSLMKIVIIGAKCGIVKERLELESEILRTILTDSVTLTPGTICLELEERDITVLCIGDKKNQDSLMLLTACVALKENCEKQRTQLNVPDSLFAPHR